MCCCYFHPELAPALQMATDGKLRLQKYSYGNDCTNLLLGANFPRSFHESCNMAVYGKETPPEYDLGKITAPQAFFLGGCGCGQH